ncbi:MAG TPA: TIGR02444 family protein [Stellaceae bacterium]|nr:TIGR02444 family protein [Stellaceae bacterium]
MGCVADNSQQKTNTTGDTPDAGAEFWSFSLAFYARPCAPAALIALQDGAGCDANLILFAIWLGLSGRGQLDEHGASTADRALQAIRDDVIEPLRVLRRRLKPAADADIQRLRQAIKALEIEAERAAQDRLASLAGPASDGDPVQRLTDAKVNLALYLALRKVSGAQAAIIENELKRFAEEALRPWQPVPPSA